MSLFYLILLFLDHTDEDIRDSDSTASFESAKSIPDTPDSQPDTPDSQPDTPDSQPDSEQEKSSDYQSAGNKRFSETITYLHCIST